MTATLTEPRTNPDLEDARHASEHGTPLPQDTQPALADLSVTATSAEWLKKLRTVGAAVSGRPPVPVLGCVLVVCRGGKATITAYDYETLAVAKLQHEPQGRLKDAKVLAPLSWLASVIRSITRRKPQALVTLAAKEMMGQRLLTISAEGYTIPILNHYPLSEFPALPSGEGLESFRIDREVLTKALDRALITASPDETMPILRAIAMEGRGKHITLLATDRYRLSCERISSKQEIPDFKFLLKAPVWKSISRHLDGDQVAVGIGSADGGGARLRLTSGDVEYTLSGVNGEYPKIEALFVPVAEGWIEVDRRDLMDQVNVAVDLNERNTPCTIRMAKTSLTVVPYMPEGTPVETPQLVADGHLALSWDAEPATSFNPHYLMEALRTITAEKVRLSFQSSLAKPMCVTPAGLHCGTKDTYRHLVMPVRMPERMA